MTAEVPHVRVCAHVDVRQDFSASKRAAKTPSLPTGSHVLVGAKSLPVVSYRCVGLFGERSDFLQRCVCVCVCEPRSLSNITSFKNARLALKRCALRLFGERERLR